MWSGWIAGLVLLPILIHLINMLRHRRVRWAAMEFLLKSHKKHRNWVWLKQWLLLASRIAILLLILFMLGQVGCHDQKLAGLLGGRVSHHYVLVDDSFSMSDSAAGASAMDHARETLAFIAGRARGRDNQRFTVLRFSRAAEAAAAAPEATALNEDPGAELTATTHAEQLVGPVADMNAQLVDSQFDQAIEQVRGNLQVSTLSTGPLESLRLVHQLIENRSSEKPLVYVVSDFRAKDWAPAPAVQQVIERLADLDTELELINCVKAPRPNLAITELAPVGSIRVAGIPLMIQIEIKNFGQTIARKVQVGLTSAAYPAETANTDPAAVEPELEDLPTILIDEIPAGESAVRRFPIFFSRPGQHAVKATLQTDSVPIDNHCWSVTQFNAVAKVLLVGGSDLNPTQYLSLAISPNRMTGIEPVPGTKATLRDAAPNDLDQYESIILADVDQLDESAVSNLTGYVQRGGGVIFFGGPNVNLRHYNDVLYRDGNGLFPLALEKVAVIPDPLEQGVPDIVPRDHPVFAPMLGIKNSPLDLVQIKQVLQPLPSDDPELRVAATARGNRRLPLVVDRKFGNGRVMAVLTTADPQWNNWSRNGTFPAVLLLMHEYVSAGRHAQPRRLVGESISYELAIDQYRPEITFVAPAANSEGTQVPAWEDRATWQVTAETRPSQANGNWTARLGGSSGETSRPGIYESWLQSNATGMQVSRMALNVDTSESDLNIAARQPLIDALSAANPTFIQWDEFQPETVRNRSTSLAKLLLVLLLIGLVLEQLLAWSASYHPKPTGPGLKSQLKQSARWSRQQAA